MKHTKNLLYIIAIAGLFLISCENNSLETIQGKAMADPAPTINSRYGITYYDSLMIVMGLLDIQKTIPGILVDLKYSGTDNFMKTDIYGDLNRAYLHPDAVKKLAVALQTLKESEPGLTLLVYDAARPVYFQRAIWDSLKVPGIQKGLFACSPKNGSVHNYGVAVDITLADKSGKPVDMGCCFDYFGELAFPVMEQHFLSTGELTPEQVANRELLRMVMRKAGFWNIPTEWWHFNCCSRDKAQLLYQRIE